MGHSSITITLDRYGHLMPGNEEEAAEMLPARRRVTTRTRVATGALQPGDEAAASATGDSVGA